MLKIRYKYSGPIFNSERLSILGIGIREQMLPCRVKCPTGNNDYLFMIFHDPVNIGEFNSDLEEPGIIVLWNKKTPYYYGNLKVRWSHSWIHCDGQEVETALQSARIPMNTPIHLSNPSRMDRYLYDLHEELSGGVEPDPVILRNTLANLIQEAGRKHPRKAPVPKALQVARETLDTRYDESLTLKELAGTAGLSLAHFCTEFRRHFGVPPIAYLQQRRMRVAAMLLESTSLRIGEIGQAVGFEDPYHFSKQFKISFGVSPLQFKLKKE